MKCWPFPNRRQCVYPFALSRRTVVVVKTTKKTHFLLFPVSNSSTSCFIFHLRLTSLTCDRCVVSNAHIYMARSELLCKLWKRLLVGGLVPAYDHPVYNLKTRRDRHCCCSLVPTFSPIFRNVNVSVQWMSIRCVCYCCLLTDVSTSHHQHFALFFSGTSIPGLGELCSAFRDKDPPLYIM